MSANIAAVAEAVTNTVPPVPFINWQYIYCWLASLFGYQCTDTGLVIPKVDVPTVDSVVDGTVGAGSAAVDVASQGGFWSWLWPFQGGGEDVVAGGAQAGSEATIGALIPGPIQTALDVLGTVFGFLWDAFSVLSYSLSGLLFAAILVALTMLILVRVKEWSDYGTLPPRASGKSYGWSRWQDLLDAAMSHEPKRWKEGMLAADDMLGELLTRLGYTGRSTAEQLRHVPDGAFVTLPQAWEAHRVRNFVAQRNSNFILTQREAFRVMKLYEQVFEEFDFI